MDFIFSFILSVIILCLIDFLLFGIFHFINKKVALYFLAVADAPLFGFNSKRIAKYCKKNCPTKKCKNCIYWTCDNYMKNIEKEN